MKPKSLRRSLSAVFLLGLAGILGNCDIVISMPGARIVFCSTMDDWYNANNDIFVMRETGYGLKNLTNSPAADDLEPAVSPDGRTIAFTSNRDNPSVMRHDIYVMDFNGANLVRLSRSTTIRDNQPKWSPDGSKIIFDNDNFEICVVNADGGSAPVVLATNAGSPSWSPDGRRIVFTQGNSVRIMDADGGNQVNLLSQPVNEYTPSWSPDGKRIAFSSMRLDAEGHNNQELWVQNADGTGLTQLTHTGGSVSNYLPRWSPNGRLIAFLSPNSNSVDDIFVVTADGARPRQQLTNNNNLDHQVNWTPDGRQLIFISNRNGSYDLYIMNADGTNQRCLRSFPTSEETDVTSWFE